MDFKQYRGKNILAWLSYNANYEDPYGGVNRVCYVYPRVLMKGADYDLVDPADFPTLGRIEVRIQGGDSAEDVYSDFGSLVNIRINGDPYLNYDGKNMYSLKYNPQYGRASSEIWIETFSGKGFYQIIDVNNSIDQLRSERSISEPDHMVRTTLILLRYEGKLYGPFEYDTKEGTMILLGVKDYQYSIGEYNAMTYNDDLLVIEDQDGEEAVILIPKTSIPTPEECSVRYDWISEKTLIDSFIDSLRVENSYTREQVRQLKDTVQQLIESGDNVQFTEERIAKIQELLQGIEQKESCVKSIVQYALTDNNMKQSLAEEVANNYFDQIQNKVIEMKKLNCLIDTLQSVGKQYLSLFDVQPLVLNTLPRKTNTFCEIKPYAQVFEIIVRWFRYGEYSLEKERLILQVKTLDKLFEYYCLLRLLKLLADNGYQKANVKEPVFKFDYVSADKHYQNEKDVANTYLLSNGEVTATLYYQPVISAVQFENDLTLFRTTKPPAGNPDYYTPDFVLKFTSSEDDEEYAIFDAKFSSRANIKKHSLSEVIRKYSCEISAASRSSAPKMVWVLQGRVNGSENAIWKYHNSQLASTYRPITSFGIVSINTAVEIRQRLWNEIRSSISLLQ